MNQALATRSVAGASGIRIRIGAKQIAFDFDRALNSLVLSAAL